MLVYSSATLLTTVVFFFTWFVDEVLYLFIQVLGPLGQGIGPSLPEPGQVVLLVTVQSPLEFATVGNPPYGDGGDGLWDQGQGPRLCHRLYAHLYSSRMTL